MDMEHEYEEFTIISPVWSWVLLIAFSLLIMAWGMFIEMIVGMEQPRTWDFGVIPDTPAESVYSTAAAPADINVPLQIERLPEAFYDKTAGVKK